MITTRNLRILAVGMILLISATVFADTITGTITSIKINRSGHAVDICVLVDSATFCYTIEDPNKELTETLKDAAKDQNTVVVEYDKYNNLVKITVKYP